MVIAGQWEIIGPLGEGGMGMVYKVRHFQMQEIVLAVKMLSPELMDNPSLLARFQREGSVMARFRHKHIVRVFSKGVEYDDSIKRYFILMEYIQGKTLRDHLRDIKLGKRQPFSLAEIVEIARQVAEALAHAHNQSPPIVHRDIKPGNIMLEDPSRDFPLGRAVVMDWGIAKELKDADDTQLTGMWTMVGTPKYCSPEQMRPLDTLTGSADIYSLGMVIYEMYTGKQFFADLDTETVIRRVRDDPTEHEPHFDLPPPPEFVALVRRAIAKSRTRRYQRMEELLRDLERCRDASSEDRTATTIIRPVPGEVKDRQALRPTPAEAEDREELRRRLEEQQRALTLELQRDAQRARERAVSEGAEEWAATVFQQAVQQQSEGEKRLGERNYFLAQDAYNEAIRLFERAREEAVAGAMRQAEQARAAMSAAKQAAERYRARERARRFYTQGLACENEAGELWEQKRYRQAADSFAKAKSAFEDARELAAETLRNEMAAVRERVEAGQQNALAEDAAVLAAAVFAEAEQQARQAAVALEREDFTLARQLYEAAAQRYAQAQQQARAERQRREILARQQREADDALQQLRAAKAAGAPLCMAVEEQWTAASQWERQGDEAYQNERYEDARQLYARAAQGYEQAKEAAEQLRRAAEEVRGRSEEARVAALHGQAQEYAAAHFGLGEGAGQEAERLWAAGRYGQAAEQYREAIQRYRAAATEAEQARQLAARALEQQSRVVQAQRDAVTAQAEVYAADLLAQARAVLARGEQELQEKQWVQAGEAFEQAEDCSSGRGSSPRRTGSGHVRRPRRHVRLHWGHNRKRGRGSGCSLSGGHKRCSPSSVALRRWWPSSITTHGKN
ncbi:MAG: protein kinase [Candidatus Binatia bacterium]|nr:protein kinase [Candidatus Binatia bacterium]